MMSAGPFSRKISAEITFTNREECRERFRSEELIYRDRQKTRGFAIVNIRKEQGVYEGVSGKCDCDYADSKLRLEAHGLVLNSRTHDSTFGTGHNIGNIANFRRKRSLGELLMKKRGRPKKDGLQPGWMLLRGLEILHEYDAVRKSGEKHSAAVQVTAVVLRKRYPDMPVSETEVKRVLATYRPRNQRHSWLVSKPEPPNPVYTLPDGKKVQRGLEFAFGPRKQYPRINARLPKR